MKKTTLSKLEIYATFILCDNGLKFIQQDDTYCILQGHRNEDNRSIYTVDLYLFNKFFKQQELYGDDTEVWLLEDGDKIPETSRVTIINTNDNYSVASLTVNGEYNQATLSGPVYNDTIIIQNKKLVIPEDITAFESANLAKFLAWVIHHDQRGHVDEFIKNHKIERLFISY